ncbi:serine hydrolase domain-containing protein [Sedimentitalea sp. XS_ASV28]|uniref:serine hydrolase domain-containing protein n=1 Tax=Sedimentitalea sp. XS_ASV28 TaxID=3241296 RepID=UPI003517D589
MNMLSIESPHGVPVAGYAREDLIPVAETFLQNFDTHGELGASLCIRLGSETVLDLWGGHVAAGGALWAENTISVVFSCTKPATALCLHQLAARGALSLDDRVADHWPEYAQAGKAGTTLRMLLDHSAGQPALRTPMKADCMIDHDYICDHLAREEPFWEPGTRSGYHPLTFGFLIGEVVRRVTGRSLGRYFRDEIAEPLGLDFSIGLPADDEPRVSPIELFRPAKDAQTTPFLLAVREKGSIPNLFVFNSGDWSIRGVNTPEGRAAEIGAASGVTNARGLAGLFGALVDGGERIGLDPHTVAGFGRASTATHMDATFLAPSRFGPGFMLGMARRPTPSGDESLVIGARAFGHVGMGGSLGLADPDAGFALGYTMNRLGGGLLLNARGQSLVDATYRCLGYRSDRGGYWTR